MFDFTNRVKKIINEYAPKEAKRLNHEYLGAEHILLGLLRTKDSVAVKILLNLNIDLDGFKREIEKHYQQDANTLVIDTNTKDQVQKILEVSREEARKLRHSYIGSEHLLLALLREPSDVLSAIFNNFSMNYQIIHNELNNTLGFVQQQGNTANSNLQQKSIINKSRTHQDTKKTPFLEEFGQNLLKYVSSENTTPVIGRDFEIQRLIQILSRKTKNNPILIGEAGVGKTAIVEGLAERILQREVPEVLFSSVIYTLDVASLIAGTKYRGEFEDRLKKITLELKSNPDIILFIDELHTIIGAGAAEGAVDAANILKPSLARGEIQCIGATTLKEYKKYIEKDTALERRFQTIIVEEPTLKDTIQILSGLRVSYEKHHHLKYSKESIKEAVRLSDRFILDRYLPDKAIDLIDEAGARIRLKRSIIPDHLKVYEKTINDLNKQKNEKVKYQKYEEAAKLRDSILNKENEYLNRLEEWRKKQKAELVTVLPEDIVEVISDWTGIPLRQLQTSESEKLLKIEDDLKSYIIGQDEAIQKISKAVKRSRAGFKNQYRPIGSFIFLGPTGVGKTQLAKILSTYMFGSEDALIRFDMGEYMEMHSVSKFIGSPPGYVGYDEGGQLTEAVRRKPYSILLFDEIEKAHPNIQNILLQVLDDGILTDTMGHKVSFKECIIIMTSNLGARALLKGGNLGFSSKGSTLTDKKEKVLDELKKHFNPEFLNRIDDFIVFNPLSQQNIEEIVEILLDDINANIIVKDIYITATKQVYTYFAKKGYDEKYGARPIARLLQREVEDELAIKMLENKIKTPSEIILSIKNKQLVFKLKKMTDIKLKKLKEEYLEEEVIDDFWEDSTQNNDHSTGSNLALNKST